MAGNLEAVVVGKTTEKSADAGTLTFDDASEENFDIIGNEGDGEGEGTGNEGDGEGTGEGTGNEGDGEGTGEGTGEGEGAGDRTGEGTGEGEGEGDGTGESEGEGEGTSDGTGESEGTGEEASTKEKTKQAESTDIDPIEKRIGKLVKEKHDARRENEAAQQEIARLQAELAALKGEDKLVQVPELLDPLDPKFSEVQKAREEAIRKNAEITARKAQKEEKAAASQKQLAIKQVQLIRTQGAQMMDRAEKVYKLKPDMFSEAEKLVGASIKNPQVAAYMLGREDCAGIVWSLAGDPELLLDISEADTGKAIELLVSKAAPKASSLLSPGKTGGKGKVTTKSGEKNYTPVKKVQSEDSQADDLYMKGVTMI